MEPIFLTDAKLRSELRKQLPEGKSYRNIFDEARPGLALRIGAKGAKGQGSWYAVKRKRGERQVTWHKLDRPYPAMSIAEARVAAGEAIALLDRGADPRVEAKRKAEAARRSATNTFAKVVEQFNADYTAMNSRKTKAPRKTATRTAAAIDRLLVGKWGDTPITEITEDDIVAHVRAIRDGGKPGSGRYRTKGGHNVARNAFVVARLVFKYARREKLIATDPTKDIEPAALYNLPAARQRTLKADELRRVWNAAERVGYPYGSVVQLLILTGARREEIAQARWSEVEGDTLVVPADRMKMKTSHAVPLTAKAREILDGLPRPEKPRGDFIFTTTGGEKPSLVGSKRKADFDAVVGPIDHWVLHDLRRTCRTGMAEVGVLDEIAERVLAHLPGGVLANYNVHRYAAEKRDALQRWEARLLSIIDPVEPEGGNVVKLKRSA